MNEFVGAVLANQADAGLVADLDVIGGEMTDEIPLP